jgi:hypothetical protein
MVRELGMFQQAGGQSRDVAIGRVVRVRRKQGRWASQGGRRDAAGENKRSERGNGWEHERFVFHKTLHLYLCLLPGDCAVDQRPPPSISATT